MKKFTENDSRHNVLPTLSTQTSKVSDSIGLHEMPAVQAPYLYPARDGGNQKCPYLFPAQDGGRTQDQDGNTNGESKRRSTCKVTQRNAQQQPHARASSTKDHAAPNPRSRGQSSGAEGNASATRQETEVEHKARVANATRGEEQPDCDTHQDCTTEGEASEHIGIHTSSNAHPDSPEATVHKPHDVTVLQDEPACDTQMERRQEEGKLQQLGTFRAKAAAGLQTSDREPRIFTPPGTAATTSVNQKNKERV